MPLYLEWAPVGVFGDGMGASQTTQPDEAKHEPEAKSDPKSAEREEMEVKQEPEEGTGKRGGRALTPNPSAAQRGLSLINVLK